MNAPTTSGAVSENDLYATTMKGDRMRATVLQRSLLTVGWPSSLSGTTTIPAGFPDDWFVLVNQAMASNVCNQPGDGGMCNPTP